MVERREPAAIICTNELVNLRKNQQMLNFNGEVFAELTSCTTPLTLTSTGTGASFKPAAAAPSFPISVAAHPGQIGSVMSHGFSLYAWRMTMLIAAFDAA